MSKPFSVVLDEAQANLKRLAGCPGPHDFVDETPEKTFGKRFRCSLCRGEIDGVARYWYMLGRKHERNGAPPAAK